MSGVCLVDAGQPLRSGHHKFRHAQPNATTSPERMAIRACQRFAGYVERAMGLLSNAATVILLVLCWAGLAKLRDPAPLGAAMLSLGWRMPRSGVRTLGVVEILLAVLGATFTPPVILGVVAAIHLGFVALNGKMMASNTASSCGCFGARKAAPSWVSIVINLFSAGILATAATIRIEPLRLDDAASWVQMTLVLLLAWMTVALHTSGSDLAASMRSLRSRQDWANPVPIAARGR